MLFVCHPKVLYEHYFQFLLGPFNSQEKLKTMILQNFEVTNKEHYGMLWYFLERSKAWSEVIFNIITTSGISKLLYLFSRAVRQVKLIFWDNLKYQVQIMLLFGYPTTHKGFVIFTYRSFKLSKKTTALSQSNCRIFWCSSINIVIEDCGWTWLTWTNHRGIIRVTAIFYAPASVLTIYNCTFTAVTTYIVQPYLTASRTKACRVRSTNSIRKSQLATNDSSIVYIPGIITNSSPVAIVEYLHSSFSFPASSNQS